MRQLLQVRSHLSGAQRAVDTYAQNVSLGYGQPEGLHGLSGECPAALIHNGDRDHDRHPTRLFIKVPLDSKQCRLQVQGVEYGLYQQEVHAAFYQTLHLRVISVGQLLEGLRAKSGIIHVGRERQGDICWTYGTRHEPRLPGGLKRVVICRTPCHGSSRDIQLVHVVL